MRSLAIALTLVLLVPLGNAGWGQLQGDAARTGQTQLVDGPWDVVARHQLFGPGENQNRLLGTGFVATEHGIFGTIRDNATGACTLLKVLDPRAGTTQRVPLDNCYSAWFQGYDPQARHVLLCSGGSGAEATLQARDPNTGAIAWETGPRNMDWSTPDDPEVAWVCTGVGIDVVGRRAYAPFIGTRSGADYVSHRIASINLDDGSVEWARVIPVTAILKGPVGYTPPQAVDGSGPNFGPISAAVTDQGIIITGAVVCADFFTCDEATAASEGGAPRAFRLAMAWLTKDGTVNGVVWADGDVREEPDERDDAAHPSGSLWPMGHGPVGMMSLGDQLVVVDPRQQTVLGRYSLEGQEGVGTDQVGWFGPVLGHGRIYCALNENLVIFDAANYTYLSNWGGEGPDWRILDVLVAPKDRLWIGVYHRDPADDGSIGQPAHDGSLMLRFDAKNAKVLQRIPIPLVNDFVAEPEIELPGGAYTIVWAPGHYPVPIGEDGLLLTTIHGDAVYLAPTDAARAPAHRVKSFFPAANEAMQLIVNTTGATELLIEWGDGTSERKAVQGDGMNLSHVFQQDGDGASDAYTALVTVVRGDGTTATIVLPITVDGRPSTGPGERLALPRFPSYPAPGVNFTVEFDIAVDPPIELFVDWRDGTAQRIPVSDGDTSVSPRHAYASTGIRDAAFTAVYADATVATQFIRFDVGGSPPLRTSEELNFFQVAFDTRHQDTTWGVIGLALAAFGGLIGLLGQRRNRSKTSRQLATLEAIRRQSRTEPYIALAALRVANQRLEQELRDGTIEDNHYRVVEGKSRALLESLRHRHLDQALTGASAKVTGLVEATLRDSLVQASELPQVEAAVAADKKLPAPARQDILRFIRALAGDAHTG